MSVRVRMRVPLHDYHMRPPSWGTEDSLESHTKIVPPEYQQTLRLCRLVGMTRAMLEGMNSFQHGSRCI
jgi:hypothetical protein